MEAHPASAGHLHIAQNFTAEPSVAEDADGPGLQPPAGFDKRLPVGGVFAPEKQNLDGNAGVL